MPRKPMPGGGGEASTLGRPSGAPALLLMSEENPAEPAQAFPLAPSGSLFGRSPGQDANAIVIGADDLALSRLCGWLGHSAKRTWCVQRRGQSPIYRERAGDSRSIPLEKFYDVRDGDALLLRGSRWYRLLLELNHVEPLTDSETVSPADYAEVVKLDIRQRRVAVALCASRLDPDSYDDSTRNDVLAELLHADPSAMDARVSRLRRAVARQSGIHKASRRELALLLVEQGAVKAADLELLREP